MKECKLPKGTGVYCNTSEASEEVVEYLKSFNIGNPNCLSGTDEESYYGYGTNGNINMNEYNFDNTISFTVFKQIISEPDKPVINNVFPIY